VRSQGKKLAALARALASQPPEQQAHNEADKANPFIAALLAAQPDAGDVELYLWEDCVELWGHWCAVQSQWAYSAGGGPTGLAYAGVRAYFELATDLQGEPLREAFACIRAAEAAHLAGFHERAERERNAAPKSL
jgi:hypothetical protein